MGAWGMEKKTRADLACFVQGKEVHEGEHKNRNAVCDTHLLQSLGSSLT